MLYVFVLFSLCLFAGSFIWLIIHFCQRKKLLLPFFSLILGFSLIIIAVSTLPPANKPNSSPTKTSTSTTVQTNSATEKPEKTSTTITNDSSTSSNLPKQTNAPNKNMDYYVGNLDDHLFHEPNCREAKKLTAGNRIYFDTRDEAIDAGYRACKICRP